MRRSSIALSFLLCGFAAQGQAQEEQPKYRLPSMTVAASVAREVVPDIAILRLSISSEKATASEAAEETARASQAVLAEIGSQGLDPRDLKTDVTVWPVYDEQRNPQGQSIARKMRGYVARNALTIRLHDTARAGALARSLIDKGANVFEGIRFELSERRGLGEELELQSIREAVRKARLYADAAGVRLGRVLTIDPDPDASSGNAADFPRSPAPIADAVVRTVIPVEPGIVTIRSRASVTWEVLP